MVQTLVLSPNITQGAQIKEQLFETQDLSTANSDEKEVPREG